MRKKLLNTILAGILFNAALVTLHAQSGSINQNSQSFTEKVNMSNVGNNDGTYYLLLCKVLPNATSKMSGTITLEFTNQETYNFEVDNNQSNVVSVKYGGVEYIAVKFTNTTHISDITFSGYADNKSLLLVHENEIEINSNPPNSSPTRNILWETGYFLQDRFSYDSKTFGHYALGWTFDSWHGGSPTLWMSAYSGMKFFTNGANPRLSITAGGNVGIGTTSPDYKLDVVGTIRAHEVLVNTQKTADFVFESDYRLRPLAEVEQFIIENKHLPEIAPASEMIENGVNMGEFQIQLLQKIEELTLYIIEQNKRINELTKEVENLKK